ncbi:MAG: pyridoxal-phosphate dependent enzyme, partial [Acidobacteriota bacterium]|nr:pyridoxal-phosphate dependent enzyme [Acidobacteriota bacterium]
VSIYAAEPQTAAPLSRSLEAGEARTFDEWTSSFVDGAGGRSVLKSMWPMLESMVEESIVVSLDDAAAAMKLVAERLHVIMEGAAACAVAAALSPEFAARNHKKVVAIVSGGNIDLSRFAKLIGACEST